MQRDGQNARRRAEADDADQYQTKNQGVNGAGNVKDALGQPGYWS